MLLRNKSEEALLTLQKVCHIQKQDELFSVIQRTLNEFERNDLIWLPTINTEPFKSKRSFYIYFLQCLLHF